MMPFVLLIVAGTLALDYASAALLNHIERSREDDAEFKKRAHPLRRVRTFRNALNPCDPQDTPIIGAINRLLALDDVPAALVLCKEVEQQRRPKGLLSGVGTAQPRLGGKAD